MNAARPDPRTPTSWCHEGVAHDHGACGALWDSSSGQDRAEAARYADDLRAAERATEPTVDAIMGLVFEYATARLVRNASTPTRSTEKYAWAREWHARDEANCARLEVAIRAALRRAGVPDEPPAPQATTPTGEERPHA